MRKEEPLQEFEYVLLTSIVLLGERACGLEICGKASEILKKSVNLGKVYMTLERLRLRDRRLVYAWLSGGRRYFRLTRRGETAFQNFRPADPGGFTDGEAFV